MGALLAMQEAADRLKETVHTEVGGVYPDRDGYRAGGTSWQELAGGSRPNN